MRYHPKWYAENDNCDDCGAFTRGMVVHDDGQPADPENGPHASEVPTMHPLCSVCWFQWERDEEVGGEDAHLEEQYEDAQTLAGGEGWF